MASGDIHHTEVLVYSGRYLDGNASTDRSASFIRADTNTNGAFTLYLRDADNTAGMHYVIEIDVGNNLLTIAPESGSSKTLNGKFAGQSLSSATSMSVLKGDPILRLKPSGGNWSIY